MSLLLPCLVYLVEHLTVFRRVDVNKIGQFEDILNGVRMCVTHTAQCKRAGVIVNDSEVSSAIRTKSD